MPHARPTRRRPASQSDTQPVLIAGFGRLRQGDDAAGITVARSAGERLAGLADVVLDAEGQDTLAALGNRQLLIIVDAAEPSDDFPAGSWLRMNLDGTLDGLSEDTEDEEPPTGVDAMLQRAKSKGLLPPVVWIYALAGERFTPEEQLSPPVQAEAVRLARRIEMDVRAWFEGAQHPD